VVQRAVLIEPILPRREWYANPPEGRNAFSLAQGARRRRAVWPSVDEVYASYGSRHPFATWRDDLLRLYVEEGTMRRADGQIELKCPPELEARFFEAVPQTDFWPLLPRVTCPTLVLWGGDSHLHANGLGKGVEDALPNARSVVVPGTSHFLPQEQPDEVARLVEEFLAD
jgi:pimeloyl-ACP methyl ester carboxylesterase